MATELGMDLLSYEKIMGGGPATTPTSKIIVRTAVNVRYTRLLIKG